MSPALRLDTTYVPGAHDHGMMLVRLVNTGPTELEDFRLALTTVIPLRPPADGPTRLIARTSGYHELAPTPGFTLPPGGVWQLEPLACEHPAVHANDGPASAFVILGDGSTRPVHTGATAHANAPRIGRSAPPQLHLADPLGPGTNEWARAAACERRLHPRDSTVLADAATDTAVAVTIDAAMAQDSYRIARRPGGCAVTAASPAALVAAFLTMAREQRAGARLEAALYAPIHGWRGLHIDLARQFIPAVDVEWLVDVVAWRGMNRLHLHLTDDEAWRVPIAAYPALTDIAAWRGHGRPIPALLGSAAEPTGGCYTRRDVEAWVDRAAALGIDVIPEVDLPGHSYAALAAIPELADPDDVSGAVSIQHFRGNVLNPGVAATRQFLETVFAELAGLFPSPWLHLGGDEVPAGAWSGSPAAQRYAAERGLAGTDAIAAAFVRDVVEIITGLGRRVGGWQEAAESGAVRPGDGYIVGWRSNDDCRRLAAAGHDVVAAPADVFYLDIATDTAWNTTGASWTGHTPLGDLERFDVTADWTPAERANLLGIQACLWTEHIHDRAALGALFPRLDAIAASAWSRTVV